MIKFADDSGIKYRMGKNTTSILCSGFAIKTKPCNSALSILRSPTWATFASPVVGSVSTAGQKTLSNTHSGRTSYGPHAINPYKKFPR